MQKNDVYTAECVGYTSEGAGVCRIEGRAVFVPNLIEGESAEIRILKVSNTAVYGKLERLLSASPERVEPDCPVYGKCGGCAVRHMSYSEELRFKRQKVQNCITRIGGLDIKADEIIGADSVDGYRNKTIFTVGEGGETGFYRARTHDLVPAPECSIESDYARRVAGAVRKYMRECRVPAFSEKTGSGVRRVMARYGFESREGQAVIVTGRGAVKSADKLIEYILSAAPETVSIMRNINPRPGDTVLSFDYERLWGRESIRDTLCGLSFDLSAGAFYQVNHDQAEKLYGKALEYAALTGSETVLDLYCGTGTITLCLAKKAGRAIGCEIVGAAIENAVENAKHNGVQNAGFICADAEKCADELLKSVLRPDVVCVDPPRKGLSPEVPGIIAKMAPERVVYVSCDPATLARDLKCFASFGYKTEKATPVDMFPRTAHVETVVLMSRVER